MYVYNCTNLQFITDNRVIVHNISNRADQFNDLLGSVVAWSGLTANHDSPRGEFGVGIFLNAVIQGDNVEAVQQLAFVLVDSLDLDVKQGSCVNFDAVILLQKLRQLQLVFLLDFHYGTLEVCIFSVLLELLQLI